MNITKFEWKQDRCIHCHHCRNVCPGQLFFFDEEHKLQQKQVDVFGWDGCWECQRCMAVCSTGAISILGKNPEDSVKTISSKQMAPMLDALIRTRRSCRRYLPKNVDRSLIHQMLSTLQNAPTGGNKMAVEVTIIDDLEQMSQFRLEAYQRMEELANQGLYAETFDAVSYQQMIDWQQYVRPDALFCGAPHILIPHVHKDLPCAVQDVGIYCAYFELLCAANGLGAVCMTYPLKVLDLMPDIKAKLHIPKDHYCSMIIGFGYSEIQYPRGVQREENSKVKCLSL